MTGTDFSPVGNPLLVAAMAVFSVIVLALAAWKVFDILCWAWHLITT